MVILRVQVVLISFETNADESVKLALPNIGLTRKPTSIGRGKNIRQR